MRLKGLPRWRSKGAKVGISDPAVNRFTGQALFSTLTNVDFDSGPFRRPGQRRRRACGKRSKPRSRRPAATSTFTDGPASFQSRGRPGRHGGPGRNGGHQVRSDRQPGHPLPEELIVYGIKGMAAYADHARILGQEDETVLRFIHEGLAATLNNEPGRQRLGGPGPEVRRDQPAGHGTAGCGQHRHLRPSRAHHGAPGRQKGQGHPRLRPRPEGPASSC